MNIKQAKEEIKNTVQAYLLKDENGGYRIPAIRQRPMLLIGPPGIGKTQIMEQIARECGIGLVAYTITHHTRQSAVGLPFIKEEVFEGKKYNVTEYTMSEIIASVYRRMQESGLKEGILFIDEINCVSETLAPTMLQFLQCKTFGNQAIPEGWIIVAAGNPPEYNKSVREFDMVTLDRVRYLNIEADLKVWKEYARARHLNGAILSYLEIRPGNFYRVEADVDGLQFVTARGWEDLSNLMDVYQELGLTVSEDLIHEFLHHADVAEDVSAYFELYQKYQDDYGIRDILAGKVKASVFARIYEAAFDERLSVVNLLLDGLNHYFAEVSEEKYKTDRWYAFLKNYRERLKETDQPVCAYEELLQEWEEDFASGKKAGLLTKEQEKRLTDLYQRIKDTEVRMREDKTAVTPKDYFLLAKEDFEKQEAQLEAAEQKAEAALNHAFTFMEQAFEKGQEMTVFVTELAVTPEAAVFLAEHPSELYKKYYDALLVGSRKSELLAELSRDDA